MKSTDGLGFVLVGAAIGLLIGFNLQKNSDSGDEERRRQRDYEERIEEQFDADFAFVRERINKRDMEIYTLAEKRDREILAEVERLSSTTNTNDYRAKLEDRLKWRLNHHIEDCIRFQSRLREDRSWRRYARHPFVDIYETKCDCKCCEKD